MRVALVLVLVLGCDRVLGLAPAGLADAPGPDAPGPPVCPSTYVQGGSSYYRYVTLGTSFLQAEAHCADDQITNSSRYTHLVIVDSLVELELIAQIVGNDTVWVGLTDLKDNTTWRWLTDELPDLSTTSMLWAAGEPSMNGAALAVSGSLTTAARDSGIDYLCECDAYPPDLARALP